MRNELQYRKDIDGLRAVAVLSVVSFHLQPKLIKGGFVGVDIFFVISGFLISSIIYRDLEADRFSIVDFYVRRIRRIYPALFVVLAAVCVAGSYLFLPTPFVRLGKQIVGGSTFVANFVLWLQSDYFSPEAKNEPLLHLWSLGVEEQYYLFFPLICIAFYRAKSRWKLPAAFITIAVLSMVLNVVFVTKHPVASFFLPFSRLWELFLGAGLSLILVWNDRLNTYIDKNHKLRFAVGVIGFAMLAAAIFSITEYNPFPGWWALLPTVGAALVITAGPNSWVNSHILSHRSAVFVGRISYPLYLWHWPILSFARTANRVLGMRLSLPLIGVITVTSSFVLAYLTYRYIELPIRQIKQKEGMRKSAIWLLGCVSLTGAFGVIVVLTGGLSFRFPSGVVAIDHDYASNASTAFRDGVCFLEPEQSPNAFRSECLDPPEGRTPLVFVWGDSHAADLISGFREVQHKSGVRLAQYTSSGCPPVLGVQIRDRPNCAAVNLEIMNRIKILKPQIVVLSAFWDLPDLKLDRVKADNLLRTIESVRDAGVEKVVVIGSAPFWKDSVPNLLIDEFRKTGNVPHRLTLNFLDAHDDMMLRNTVQKAGGVYLPLFEDLCDASSCMVTTGSSWQDVMTYDQAHFTTHGSQLVAQRIWEQIVP